MTKTVKKSTAAIVLTATVLCAVLLAALVLPLLIQESTVITVGHCYPAFTLSELAEESDRVEHCRLLEIKPAAYTSATGRADTITTDYIFESLEPKGGFFILRLIGGTVEDTTVQNSDGTLGLMMTGVEYVLFLGDMEGYVEPASYTVEGSDTPVTHCYSLMTGSASVFVMGILNQDGTLSSADNQYIVSPDELSALFGAK